MKEFIRFAAAMLLTIKRTYAPRWIVIIHHPHGHYKTRAWGTSGFGGVFSPSGDLVFTNKLQAERFADFRQAITPDGVAAVHRYWES